MLDNETLTSDAVFKQGTNVEINLNSYQLDLNGKYFRTYGDLIVNGDDSSNIISKGQVLNNSGTGTLTINGGNYERTSGTETTIYNEGAGTIIVNDGKFVNSSGGTAVQNRVSGKEGGIVNINGGTYFGGYMGISNHYDGVINILSGDISSGWSAIANMRTATTNICGANISSLKYDLYGSSNVETGVLNYSSSVKFTNGTNAPLIGGKIENIVPNYTGTCS